MRRVLLFSAVAGVLAVAALPAKAASPAPTLCASASVARVVRADLAGAPAILRIPARVRQPPIVLWHGFGPPDSAAALMDALPLDDVPAVKVYVDLPLFGARAPADPADQPAARQARDYALQLFQPAVMGAADELPAIVDSLRAQGCLGARSRIGLFGFSASGAAVLTALAEHKAPVRAAVVVDPAVGLGPAIAALEHATHRPYDWTPAARALAARSDAAGRTAEIVDHDPPPLLMIQGGEDAVVEASGTAALQAALAPLYRRAGHPERLRLAALAGLGHDWTAPQDRIRVGQATAAWFDRRR